MIRQGAELAQAETEKNQLHALAWIVSLEALVFGWGRKPPNASRFARPSCEETGRGAASWKDEIQGEIPRLYF
jgi:hypothetical protein